MVLSEYPKLPKARKLATPRKISSRESELISSGKDSAIVKRL